MTIKKCPRVLVCGSRSANDRGRVFVSLTKLFEERGGFSFLLQGGAGEEDDDGSAIRGVDLLARDWARAAEVPSITFLAEWDKHGRAAGPIRNQQMLDDGRPDLVVAFPGGRGTADMVRRASKAGIEVVHVS
jgi:hypothetical protein